jgi:hypothetical protein
MSPRAKSLSTLILVLSLAGCGGGDCDDSLLMLFDAETLDCAINGERDEEPLVDDPPYDMVVAFVNVSSWEGKAFHVTTSAGPGWSGTFNRLPRQDRIWQDVVEPGRTVTLDAWVDHDGDGACDPPPVDAVWHLEQVDPTNTVAFEVQPATGMAATCP